MSQPRHTIVTHAGAFHSDELMALVLLARFYLLRPLRVAPAWSPDKIRKVLEGSDPGHVEAVRLADGTEDHRTPTLAIRTRDPGALELATAHPDVFVVDVGGKFQPTALNFDHHQAGMTQAWEDGTPLSSTGMIWLWLRDNGHLGLGLDLVEEMEASLIRPLDAHDNGVEPFPAAEVCEGFNRNGEDPHQILEQFSKALDFMGQVLDNALYKARAKIESRHTLEAAWQTRGEGEDFVILDKPLEFSDGTALLREVSDGQARLLGLPGKGGRYNLISTSSQGRFSVDCPVPKEWRGRMDFLADVGDGGERVEVAFAHKTGFMCVIAGGQGQALRVARFVSASQPKPTRGRGALGP